MLKAASFALAGILLVSIVLAGTDAACTHRLPTIKKTSVPRTAAQVCRLRGYQKACAATSSAICSAFKCQGLNGFIGIMGPAPDGMWCGFDSICIEGECVQDQTVDAPTADLLLVNCN